MEAVSKVDRIEAVWGWDPRNRLGRTRSNKRMRARENRPNRCASEADDDQGVQNHSEHRPMIVRWHRR